MLTLILATSGFAGGIIPITGFTGCENGLYYPDTGECVAGLAPSRRTDYISTVYARYRRIDYLG